MLPGRRRERIEAADHRGDEPRGNHEDRKVGRDALARDRKDAGKACKRPAEKPCRCVHPVGRITAQNGAANIGGHGAQTAPELGVAEDRKAEKRAENCAAEHPNLLLGDDHVPEEDRRAGHRVGNPHHLGVLQQPVDFGEADTDENRRHDHGEHVGLTYRPENQQVHQRRQNACGNRRQQICRPIAEVQAYDYAVGRPGAGEGKGTVSEIHDARCLVDDDDTEGGESIDGPKFEATDDHHQEFGKHLRLPTLKMPVLPPATSCRRCAPRKLSCSPGDRSG